jgi:DnaJ like chaperone protein
MVRFMSIWGRVAVFISYSASEAFASLVETVRTALEGDPQTRRQVAFSIAIIALSAKMAKADGVVTRVEVSAFQEIFAIPDDDAKDVSRVYNLARQDVAGFGAYARRLRDLFPNEHEVLADVMDGLFHIAKADGMVHEKEMEFLDRVATVFAIEAREYERIKLRHLHPEEGDPYLLLDASSEWDNDRLKAQFRKLARENHPDTMAARGVPPEFASLANARLATLNAAWDAICKERGI